MSVRVLIVDDEVRLLKALKQLFSEQQYQVETATDGLAGLSMARAEAYDLLIVDVMLPGLSGVDLVRKLRDDGNSTPTLLLTARDAVDDRVQGLDSGADDYLVKPFAAKELLARARALTRRSGEVVGPEQVQVGDIVLDLISRTVYLGDAPLTFTAREFQLLEFFLRHPGQVLPKELILDRVWGLEAAIELNSVETYVHFLRKKLDAHRALHNIEPMTAIETVRGVGYVFKEM